MPTTDSQSWDPAANTVSNDSSHSGHKKVNPKIQLKRQIEKFVADRGFTLANSKKANAVKDLLQHLHPVTTRFDLTRLGQPRDGGYLIPDDLDGLVACFSPGVDVKSSFEAELAAKSIPCYLADASVDGPAALHPLIHFQKKFLGVMEDETTITLDKWVNENAPGDGDLLLQMDIEGAEAHVLHENASWLRLVDSIKVEVHEPATIEQCTRDLSEAGFTCSVDAVHQSCVVGVRKDKR